MSTSPSRSPRRPPILLPLILPILSLGACAPDGDVLAEGMEPFESIASAYVVDFQLDSNGERIFTGDVTIFGNVPLDAAQVEAVLRLKELVLPSFWYASVHFEGDNACQVYLREYQDALEALEEVAVAGTTLGLLYTQQPPKEEGEGWIHRLKRGRHVHDLGWTLGFMDISATDPSVGPIFNLGLIQFTGASVELHLAEFTEICEAYQAEGAPESGRAALEGTLNSGGMNAALDARRYWLSDGGVLEVERLGEGPARLFFEAVTFYESEPERDTRPDALPGDPLQMGGPSLEAPDAPPAPVGVIHAAEFAAEPLSLRARMDG